MKTGIFRIAPVYVLLLLTLVAPFLQTSRVEGIDPTEVRVLPPPLRVVVGRNSVINIEIQDVFDMQAFSLKVSWDPRFLEYATYDIDSPWMGIFIITTPELNQVEGYLRVGAINNPGQPGFTGTATVLEVTFKALKSGDTMIDVQEPDIFPPPVEIMLQSASLTIQPGDITVPDDYATIQQAIDAATVGNVIFIRNGTYYEQLSIRKPLTLLGESNEGVTINGTDADIVIDVSADNVTIKRLTVATTPWALGDCLYLEKSRYCSIADNKFSTWGFCIRLSYSHENTVAYNVLGGGYQVHCVDLFESSNNMIIGNVQYVDADTILNIVGGHDNFIAANRLGDGSMGWGVALDRCTNNFLINNQISGLVGGIALIDSNGSRIWHNSVVIGSLYSDGRVYVSNSHNTTWDAGYPSGGNYWWWLTGSDDYCGSYQNETGSDGIIDTPLWIDSENVDNYPLMREYQGSPHKIGITANVILSKTVTSKDFMLGIYVKAVNYGIQEENFSVTLFANTTAFSASNLTLSGGSVSACTVFWNTSDFDYGNYKLTACTDPLPGENDTLDNTHFIGTVEVTLTGDVDGNGWVDMRDIGHCCSCFGLSWWSPSWNGNVDFNFDGRIDMRDIGIACSNFGKK